MKTIDAHIHLDLYPVEDSQLILHELAVFAVEYVVAVSMNLSSSRTVLELQRKYPHEVKAAFGFHPEQVIPSLEEIDVLFQWIELHQSEMSAIGEVGLPYYNRLAAEEKNVQFELQPYIDLLERFIALSVKLEKPIVLHAVYEDADIVCDLLAKYGVLKAHFHWFKGNVGTVNQMIANGYFISFTPDILYEQEIQELAALYPLSLMMVETDGPWPFEGPFSGKVTHPRMLIESIGKIAEIKGIAVEVAAETIRKNTLNFYNIKTKA